MENVENVEKKEKIFITGTGRCGTTFLIKLFSFLNFDTGYNRDNYMDHITQNCNSGMERIYNENFNVIKNPKIIVNAEFIFKDPTIKIKAIIIPVRDYKSSAISRVSHKNKNGGLWNAIDEKSQIAFYNKIISNYIYYMTKYEINTIFIDFDKMINDKLYLFNKLKSLLDEKTIDFDEFSSVYEEVSLSSRHLKT
jgi:hypothetical protein